MLHRIQIDGISRDEQFWRDSWNLARSSREFFWESLEFFSDSKRELRGVGCSPLLAHIMGKAALPSPRLTHRRARFYFTDLGWHRVGARLLHVARLLGYTVKYTRRGRPRQSQIVYQDKYQVALLPIKRRRR